MASRKQSFIFPIAAVLGLLVADLSLAAERPVIRIGATASLTGAYEVPGTSQLQGLQMWAADLNTRGALLGHHVELIAYDDESDPATSAALYRKLIEEDGVQLLIGPYGSDITLAASEIADQHGMPMVAAGAAARNIWMRGNENIFQIDTPAGQYMDLPLALARQEGLTRVALVYADSAFPREVAAGAREAVSAFGMELVVDQSFPEGSTDFGAIAGRLAAAAPEVLLGGTYLEDSIALVRAAKAAKVSPKIFAMTVGPAFREFGEALGPDAEGIMGTVAWMRSGNLPMAYDFSYRYKQRFGSNAAAQSAYGYAAGQVLEAAVRLAGSLEPAAVREQLRTMKFRSLLGHYRVDDAGIQVGKKTYVLQWQSGYRLLVLPDDLRDAPVRFPFVPWSAR
jgi:branched-chain amino acid transport system substrate-binding protein